MIRMEQFFCFRAQGLSQEFSVQPLDLGVLVGIPQGIFRIQPVELFAPHFLEFFIVLGDGLASAAGTAARAGHHFYEIIMDLFSFQGPDQLPGIAQTADYGTPQFFAS